MPWSRYIVCLAVFSLVACSEGGHQDLRQFMQEVKQRPQGEIEPLPTFPAYEAFSYSAVGLRSPFEVPVPKEMLINLGKRSDVKPDFDRPREFLEDFNLAALTMVGTLQQNGQRWALIDDGAGGIHRVTVGDHMGKNHGRVVSITEAQIDVVEIVPDGAGGWIERPQTKTLRESQSQDKG